MKKLKNIVIFMLSWMVSTYLVMLVISALYPAGPDGKITLGATYTIIVTGVPITAGIFFVKYLPQIMENRKAKNQRINFFGDKVDAGPPLVLNIDDLDLDELFSFAVDVVLETHQASVSMLQRKLGLSYSRAAELLKQMECLGVVGPFDGSSPRKILVAKNYWKNLAPQYVAPKLDNSRESPFSAVDAMEGHDFERWCAEVLRGNGFSNVEVTQGSGDQGVDILAEKDGIKYAVQCKCYSSDLGNKPVQEVNAGKMIYRCQIGAVMTNRYFTSGAKQAAEATGVLLWSRDDVEKMAQKAGLLTSTP